MARAAASFRRVLVGSIGAAMLFSGAVSAQEAAKAPIQLEFNGQTITLTEEQDRLLNALVVKCQDENPASAEECEVPVVRTFIENLLKSKGQPEGGRALSWSPPASRLG